MKLNILLARPSLSDFLLNQSHIQVNLKLLAAIYENCRFVQDVFGCLHPLVIILESLSL